MPQLQADVLVVGAGPAGSTLALNLARWHKVLVLDSQTLHPDLTASQGGGSARPPSPVTPPWPVGENLPAAAQRLLQDMGLWDGFIAQGHLPCDLSHSTWGSEQLIVQDAMRNLDGGGWHLDRPRFDGWLRSVASLRGAGLLPGVRRVSLGQAPGGPGWRVQVERTGQAISIETPWVVDATGRSASVARQVGAKRQTLDKLACGWLLGQTLGVTAAQVAQAPAEVHAEPDGWWYSAGLPGHQRLLAFYTDADLPSARDAHHSAALLARASQVNALRSVLASTRFEATGPGGFCAAQSAVLTPCAGPGWLAVGDAALSFDPLSSQGLFNALYTGLAGAQALHQQLSSPVPDPAALAGYGSALDHIQAGYLQHLRAWYGAEQRWPDQPFWQRRHAGQTR